MKTYIKTTLTILISGMLFSSCEDQLNQANPNQATEDTFWKDETDFNLALTSCYTPLKNALNGGYYGTRGVMLRIARADEVDFRNDISDVYTVNRFTNSNTNSLTQGMFYQFYNALYRTNSIMQKLEEKKEQFSTDFQNSVKGECLFIRGFYLFQLAKEFKDAPLRLTASQSPSTFPLAKSSQVDIWAQAKEDLKTAASLLPITNKKDKDGNFDYRARCSVAWDYEGCTYYQRPFREVFAQDKWKTYWILKYQNWKTQKDEPAPPKSFINERAIRYADVLLMLAEAYMNKGALDTSIGYINQIRRRANLNDYSGPITKEGVFEDLVHQRAIEFFVEGERFYDLRRWGLLEQTLKTCDDTRYKNYQTGKSGNINKFNYFPIPAKELDTNPLCTPSEGW